MDALNDKTLSELLTSLRERHRDLLRPGEVIELVTHASARHLRVVVSVSGGSDGTKVEMEVKVDYAHTGLRGDDALALGVDAVDMSLGEYLESGRSDRLPGSYEVRDLEGRGVAFRGRVRRPSLEAEADRLLGEASSDEW